MQAKGVAAVVQAVHLGDGPAPAAQLSSGATGVFSDPASGRLQEFVTLLRLSGRAAPPAACFADQPAAAAGEQAAAAGEQAAASSSLVQATDTLLHNVGEDPSRKVRWLRGGRRSVSGGCGVDWIACALVNLGMGCAAPTAALLAP